MSTLQGIVKNLPRRPGRTLVLEPWVFADDWERKPDGAVCVGLRIMSDGAKSKARAEAEKLARELHPTGNVHTLEAYNDALMRQCAALGISSPNDVEAPSEILPVAEEQVRYAISSRGARFIFESLLKYEIESSPLTPEADDAELDELVAMLALLKLMTGERAATARRFARYALDAIRQDQEAERAASRSVKVS